MSGIPLFVWDCLRIIPQSQDIFISRCFLAIDVAIGVERC